jgi:hypothetical protein
MDWIGYGDTDREGETAVAKGLWTMLRHGGKNGRPNWGCLVAVVVALAIVAFWLY